VSFELAYFLVGLACLLASAYLSRRATRLARDGAESFERATRAWQDASRLVAEASALIAEHRDPTGEIEP
jgi:hypothetical protein